MRLTEDEMMEYIRDNDVKFIKLSFTDIFGSMKVISILPPMMEKAMDTGILIDHRRLSGYEWLKEPLYLKPDTSSITLLPWRPTHGRVARLFCSLQTKKGKPFEGDPRNVLKKACDFMAKNNISAETESQTEFYLFKKDEDGNITNIPFDTATYMDAAPDDRGEDVRREICLTLEDMGVTPLMSHHNSGPGQNEIEFMGSDPMTAADNIMNYRYVVKTMADLNGLYASFMPKPIPDAAGSRLRLSITPRENGNLCSDKFLNGVLQHISEMTAIINPSDASYDRLKVFAESEAKGGIIAKNSIFDYNTDSGKIWFNTPDASSNPYLTLALIIYAGVMGIISDGKNEMIEPKLPLTLSAAREICAQSSFIVNILPKSIVNKFIFSNLQ
jgi:glutamine synthetase